MAIAVDIADRLYDYTDEEKAADAVAEFQSDLGISDDAVIALWMGPRCQSRDELERKVFDAVDDNGSVARAKNSIPDGITLLRAG